MSDEQGTISMALDAFIFNEKVCGDEEQNYRIAPLAQPNYSFLSYDKALVRDEVMDTVELQNAFPPRNNSRYSDVGRDAPRTSRLGVYLHWVLPNMYRTGEATVPETSDPSGNPAPTFKAVPNRWLVIRQIKAGTQEPKDAVLDEFQGWVVESDRRLGVDELGDGVDTQVDVSPYVSTEDTTNQGRYFIGMKKPVADWAEDNNANRVELTVLSSSNQLFADYQPHNGNVFSILDTFDQKLTAAELNYFVIGWHYDKNTDPLHAQFDSSTSLQERLTRLHVRMRHNSSKALLAAVAEEVGGTLCCGHIHNVKWSLNEKPTIVPAEEAAARFQTSTSPIAIGTGPLDALLAYISAHDSDIGSTERLILKIQTLLLRQDEGVDAQLEAEDMLMNRDYSRIEGGIHWYMAGENPDESAPLQPSRTQLDTLTQLNAFQNKLDTLKRLLPQARWDLFSEWWKYVCDEGEGRNPELMKDRVKELTDRLEELIGTSDKPEESIVDYLPRIVAELINKVPVEPGASARFHMQQEPTMLIAGLQSGWPRGHTESSEITMTSYIRATTRVSLPDVLTDMVAKLPSEYQDTATQLLEGFLGVSSNPEAAIRAYAASGKDAATIEPQFWSQQPWNPLFLEWEGEYFHVPFDKFWSLEERQTGTPNKVLRYGIKDGEDLSAHDLINDKRTISGRVLLLPQPSFSLSAQVTQLFDSMTEKELDEYLTKEERDQLQEDLETFPYMSAPLAGFTEHLLTLLEGTHVKPNQRQPGSDVSVPIQQAIDVASAIDIKERQLELVDQETGPTPYWNHVAGLGNTYPAFKAAAHGQFRFTKINIIDKFGQAICAINPTPRPTPPGPPPIYPCISNFFACQPLSGDPNTPNTVIRDDPGKNQFIQLPPRLNQPARLNAGFMMGNQRDGWRPATEWENPVFGWMVVNHANYGLQIFLPEGRFYREVRLGGQSGSSLSDPWLPFGPPKDGIPETEALDSLIQKMVDSVDYLKAFFKMVQEAFQSVVEAPDSYAEFLSAIIGKPIALVNIGWSLELAAPPLENQSLFNQVKVTETLDSYQFPLKIGDRNRVFDGLVGYYPPLEGDTIYTHFPGNEGDPTIPISMSNYPTLTPFHIDPRGLTPVEFVSAKNQEWKVYTGILDPFVAVHGYSGILPIDDTLLLPTWTVELALNRMTAFFHLGPLLVSADVPSFDPNHELTYDYDLENSQTEYPGNGVTLPSLNISEWNWLQPYYSQDQTKFMGLKLDRMPEKPPPIQEMTPPYTAIEGYLQLKRPLGQKFEAEEGNK